jgi:TonB-linked SusC/RagA family outer membrane protein
MKKLLLLAMCCFYITAQLMAQNRTITGKVTDASGNPVVDVSVQVKNSTIGTSTRADGTYSLSVPSSATTLVFSHVDLGTQEIAIRNQSSINVTMQTSEKALQEVVIVGYGTQKRQAVTSSVSKIAGDVISDQPLASVDKQLAGKAAGININMQSGIVNAEPRIRIRGSNSITQSRDPLIVVDGIPVFSAREGGLSRIANTNPLSDINPSDIESVEVLKDGAATAIYGSRAANGVILVTTKKGKAGKSSVSYDMFAGFSTVYRKPELLNAEEFVTIANEKLTNAGAAPAAFMNAERTNTDWLDVIFRDRAVAQSHTVSLTGGSEKMNYYVSLNATNLQGIIISNSTKRYNVRANLEVKPAKFIRFGNNITLSKVEDTDENNGGNSLSGAMAAALRALPNVRVYNPDHPTGYNITPPPANDALGSDSNKRKIENNYVNIKYVLDNNKFSSSKYRIIDNAFVEISPVAGLSIRSQGSIDYQNAVDFQYYNPVHGDGRGSNGFIRNQNLQRTRFAWQNYFNYNHTIGSLHNIGLTGGMEIQRDTYQRFFGDGTDLSDAFFGQVGLITNTYGTTNSGGFYDKAGFESLFGRVSYDFAGKYFAQFSIRRDGQSRLADESRYGVFPGGSVGWRLSEEGFWKESSLARVMSEVKFRGSYAVVGNTITAWGSYPYLSTFGAAPYGSVSGNAGTNVGNRSLQWETNKKMDVGADITFFNRFDLTVDYYKNNNDKLVYDVPTAPSLGIPANTITKNIATMVNKGFEFSITGDVLKKKAFVWNVNFNFTTQDNKVLSLFDSTKEVLVTGPNSATVNAIRVGEPINSFYGYKYAGVNSGNGNPMWYKADGSLVQYNAASGAAAGYYLVVKPGDPTLGARSTLAATDRVVIGSPVPTWYGGFTNTFNYKGIGLDVFFRFQGGNQVYNLTAQEVLYNQDFLNNGKGILNRWTPTNTNTDVPRLYYGGNNNINQVNQGNSRFVEDADFLRLQNVTLSYNFNRELLTRISKGAVKGLRIYVQGQNLAIWTKYSGIDPEATSGTFISGTTVPIELDLGIDNSSVPMLRTYTAGLTINF